MAIPTTTEQNLLNLIAEYRVLLTSQITLLRGVGLRATQKILKSLFEKGYIKTVPHITVLFKGRPENMSSLSIKGAELLKTEGVIDSSFSTKLITGEGIVHLDHELLINWIRIHLQQIDKNVSELESDFISGNTPFLPRRKNGMPAISDVIENGKKDEWFVPDGIFSVKSKKKNQRLLFFLELDCATESIHSANIDATTISRKVKNYHLYFINRGYKRYEKKWADKLNGFRVLLVTTYEERTESILHYLKTNPNTDFIWITDIKQIFLHGLGGKIWKHNNSGDAPLDSILGPTMACNLPLPKY